MTAEELMIRDYVTNEGVVMQLTGTDLFDLYMGYMNELSPIPLTAEILKANGWADWSIMLNHIEITIKPIGSSSSWAMCINLLEETDSFSVKTLLVMSKLQHVHELQHALRLCGLTNFANNLKIK